MILSAGLTPAWQQILSFDQFQPSEVNRAKQAQWCASGKVINVGMGLATLGANGETLCLIGGKTGEAIREEFAARNIPARWIESNTPTRICTTILDQHTGQTTELVENSAPVSAQELANFERAFEEEAHNAKWVVLSGSLPQGVPATWYRDRMKQCRGRVILDIRGAELVAALDQQPFLIKPNHAELAKTVERELPTEAETLTAMRELNQRGADWVVITQGAGPVLATHQGESYRLWPPVLPVVNPIGCGDSFAAGLAWGFSEGLTAGECLVRGVAAAAENLGQHLPARLDPNRVEKIAAIVRMEKLIQ